MNGKSTIALSLLALLLPASFYAQTFRGAVGGTVSDASGAAVSNAQVKLVSPDTGLTRDGATSSAGDFVFQDLPLGKYDVTVTSPGFNNVQVTGVVVDAGKTSSLALVLDVAKQATTVNVEASTVSVETASSAQTSLIDTKEMLDVPLNGRDFTQLLKFNPGANAQGSVNGSRPNGVDWKIDGADNNDLWHNSNAVNQGGVSGIGGVLLPMEAIDEFSLQSGSNAEEGRNSGGALNVVVKSGTNTFHGTAYYFNRNEVFATNNWFTTPGTPSTELRNNQFGFSLGGPIVKNHTFFFMNYEQQDYKQALTAPGTTPSGAWVSQTEQVMARDGVQVNPLALTLLSNLWPANSLTGPASIKNYAGAGINKSDSYNAVIKIDHHFNDKNNLAFRFFGGEGPQTEYVGSAMPDYFQYCLSRMYNFSVVDNQVFTPRFLGQTVVGVNYFVQIFNDANHGFNMPAMGFNDGVTNTTDFGAPKITITGFDPTGETPPLGRIDTTGHIDQSFTYTVGAHQFRFGGGYRRSRLDVFYDANAPGTFNFTGSQGPFASATGDTWGVGGDGPNVGSINALADFLSMRLAPGQATIAYGNQQRNYWLNGFSAFVQDSWKVTPNLTLNYGLNWTYQSPIDNPANLISTFIPSDGGIVYTGHGINPLWPHDFHDFGPRVGFAFQPKANGKLVIRGGWGMYYQIPNLDYFGNSSSPNGAATGINGNIGGPNPVLNLANQNPITLQAGVQIFGGIGAEGPFGAFSVSQHFVDGYSFNSNFNIQYELARDTVLQLGYSGSLSRHLPDTLDINQIPIGAVPVSALQAGLPLDNSLRPYASEFPNLGPINEVQSIGNGEYNSFQLSLRTANFHGFSTRLAYTLAHSMDELSGARGIIAQNSYCLQCEWANSDFDIRNTFSMFLSYSLPQPSRYKLLLGGWQLNTLFSFFTGIPFTVTEGINTSGTYEFDDRAEVVGKPFAGVPSSDRSASTYYWFNPNAFALPALGTYSNQGRNEFYGPSTHQIDFSIFKEFAIHERLKLQLRAEIYNIFNFVNYSSLSTNQQSASLGTAGGTYDVGFGAPGIGPGAPRNVQLAAKIIF